MLSPDGRCKTLDAAADGYVRGEAVAAVMLQALPAGSSGYASSFAAVVLASAVNQDGRSSGLTAPNGPAQQAVIRAALADGGLQPCDVTALSMHGTGTPLGKYKRTVFVCKLQLCPGSRSWRKCVVGGVSYLLLLSYMASDLQHGMFVSELAGDPIEMGAIAAVLLSSKAQQQRRTLPLTIASDKSGIGHTEPAAGMAGLVHAAAAAAGHAALPVLHLRALNPYLVGALEAPGIAATISIPRQQRGAVLGQHSAGSISGISSFAFQVRLTRHL